MHLSLTLNKLIINELIYDIDQTVTSQSLNNNVYAIAGIQKLFKYNKCVAMMSWFLKRYKCVKIYFYVELEAFAMKVKLLSMYLFCIVIQAHDINEICRTINPDRLVLSYASQEK